MWIDPDEFAAWYRPTDATVEVTMWDLHAGGGRQLSMVPHRVAPRADPPVARLRVTKGRPGTEH